jgi:hypothetical protein
VLNPYGAFLIRSLEEDCEGQGAYVIQTNHDPWRSKVAVWEACVRLMT